jgi:hypothetical protein
LPKQFELLSFFPHHKDSVFKIFDDFKKTDFPLPRREGTEGRGIKTDNFYFIHPHPDPWSPLAPPKAGKPLPSRERERMKVRLLDAGSSPA